MHLQLSLGALCRTFSLQISVQGQNIKLHLACQGIEIPLKNQNKVMKGKNI